MTGHPPFVDLAGEEGINLASQQNIFPIDTHVKEQTMVDVIQKAERRDMTGRTCVKARPGIPPMKRFNGRLVLRARIYKKKFPAVIWPRRAPSHDFKQPRMPEFSHFGLFIRTRKLVDRGSRI